MKVAITGATSMIGVAIINECISKGDQVYAIVRKNSKRLHRLPQSDLVYIIECELENLDQIGSMHLECDVFYHMAWIGTDKENRDNPVIQQKNIEYTLKAVELAHCMGCRKFIGAGSQAEYGPVQGVISQTTVPNPQIAYGMAKLSASLLSKKLCEKYHIIHIWGRIFSVYGVNDNENTMIDYALNCFEQGRKASFSAGDHMWNYLYETDAAKMFYLLGWKDVISDVYFIAHNQSYTLREYIQIMIDEYGKTVDCCFSKPDLSGKIYGLDVDVRKTIRAIGFTPEIDFQTGMRKIIRYRRNGK